MPNEEEKIERLSKELAKKFPTMPINMEWNIARYCDAYYAKYYGNGLNRDKFVEVVSEIKKAMDKLERIDDAQ